MQFCLSLKKVQCPASLNTARIKQKTISHSSNPYSAKPQPPQKIFLGLSSGHTPRAHSRLCLVSIFLVLLPTKPLYLQDSAVCLCFRQRHVWSTGSYCFSYLISLKSSMTSCLKLKLLVMLSSQHYSTGSHYIVLCAFFQTAHLSYEKMLL